MKAVLMELSRIMPPHATAGMSVDWSEVADAWGVNFPIDYREFVATYGAGVIENYLVVLTPEVDPGGQSTGGMIEETETARDLWDDADRDPGVMADATSQQLIAWGVNSTADLLCWLTVGDNPECWPVLVYGRGEDVWRQYPPGMVEFLCRVFTCDVPEGSLSGKALWRNGRPRFLTFEEQRRLKDLGRDPWA
ncbi:hypothetical protein SSP531S_02750 [Streptomyces spongiicola]|uniref:SMI1/KNR4 family protein n=1 Tax=Streptomyces spongiicola TaxID=1690221 RepID=A0A388SQH2_9ACTN|nr:hypothetical protein SSP531S_02750 [Streptomyces spongiicola]